MVTLEAVCKNKDMALLIIGTITKAMKAGTQKAALESVAEWIQEANFDWLLNLTEEERQTLILKYETEMRGCMTDEERREMAAFYLEGIKA
jgi:hypothetical protein